MKSKYLTRPGCREDWIDFTQTPTETSVCLLTPVGEEAMMEVRDGLYRKNQGEPYHQHTHGNELFYLYRGTAMLTVRGKRCRLQAGDMAFIPANVPHALLFPGEDTGFRLFLQGMNVYQRRQNRNVIAQWYPQIFENQQFAEDFARSTHSLRREPCEAVDVEKGDIHEVRTASFAWSAFDCGGAVMSLIVGRWETESLYEVWRCEAEKGFCARWDRPHQDWELYQVTKGAVSFRVLDESFTACAGDLVRIPPYAVHQAHADADSTIYAIGCKGQALAMLEDRASLLKKRPEALRPQTEWEEFSKKYGCHITGFGMRL